MSDGMTNVRRGRPAQLSTEAAGNSTALIGLELLKAIAKAARPMPLTEIARVAGMSASRTHRYLSSLQHAGFVLQNESTGRYGIGPSTIEIGIAAMKSVDGSQIAAAVMKDLTERTVLCSYLCIWGSNGPTVIRSEMGEVQTAVRMRMGTTMSLLTATGQIFLSHMPEERTRDFLKRDIEVWKLESPESTASVEKSMRLRARVQKMGIAKTRGMRNPTWTAFSCPVFDPNGDFRMALTVIGVSALFDTSLDGPVAEQLKASAKQLSSTIIT